MIFPQQSKVRLKHKGDCFEKPTCEVFQALAGVAALSAVAPAPVLAGPRVAEVDLRLAVVSGETERTAAAQPVDGVDGSEQNRVGGDEGRGAVKLQH